jgi:hypothetical protein
MLDTKSVNDLILSPVSSRAVNWFLYSVSNNENLDSFVDQDFRQYKTIRHNISFGIYFIVIIRLVL